MLATGPPSISILHPFQVLIVCCTYIVLLIPGALQITASFFFFFFDFTGVDWISRAGSVFFSFLDSQILTYLYIASRR